MSKQKFIILTSIVVGSISLYLSLSKSIEWRYSIPIILIIMLVSYKLVIEEQKQTAAKSIVESLTMIKNGIIPSLKNRRGRSFPDVSMVNLRIIDDAINSIKLNGYIEFQVQNMGLEVNKNSKLALYQVIPGMHQRFIILENPQEPINFEDKKMKYLRIYPVTVDDRDFVETWFEYIFPILGNFSETVSEKMMGNSTDRGEISEDCFYVNNFKYIKNKKNSGFDRLRIYIK